MNCLIEGSTLIDPPWPEDAWKRAGEDRASGKVKRFNMFDTWVQYAPAVSDFLGLMNAGRESHGADVDLTVGRGLQSGEHPALRDAFHVGLAQRHMDDVVAGIHRESGSISPARPNPATPRRILRWSPG